MSDPWKLLETATDALRMIREGTPDEIPAESWSAGVAMSALASIAEQEGPCSCGGSFTMRMQLCDDDGIVRRGAMHRGQDYTCTGTAHFAGEHIRCLGPTHIVAEVA